MKPINVCHYNVCVQHLRATQFYIMTLVPLSGCYTLVDAIGAAQFSFPTLRRRPSARLVRSANVAFLSTRRPMLPAMSNAG